MPEKSTGKNVSQLKDAFFEKWDLVLSEDAQICNFDPPFLDAATCTIAVSVEQLPSFGEVLCMTIHDHFMQKRTQYFRVPTSGGTLIMVKQRTQVSAGDMVLLSKMSPEKFDQMSAEAERLSDFQK